MKKEGKLKRKAETARALLSSKEQAPSRFHLQCPGPTKETSTFGPVESAMRVSGDGGIAPRQQAGFEARCAPRSKPAMVESEELKGSGAEPGRSLEPN
jgi:hypothetical protein